MQQPKRDARSVREYCIKVQHGDNGVVAKLQFPKSPSVDVTARNNNTAANRRVEGGAEVCVTQVEECPKD